MSDCCRSAGVLYRAEQEQIQSLAEYGLSFGMAFQLVDDLIDQDARVQNPEKLYIEAENYLKKAREALHPLGPSVFKEKLFELCEYLLDRAAQKGPTQSGLRSRHASDGHASVGGT